MAKKRKCIENNFNCHSRVIINSFSS